MGSVAKRFRRRAKYKEYLSYAQNAVDALTQAVMRQWVVDIRSADFNWCVARELWNQWQERVSAK